MFLLINVKTNVYYVALVILWAEICENKISIFLAYIYINTNNKNTYMFLVF